MVEYYIPGTLQELIDFVDNNETIIVAGATDVMVQRRNWAELPATFSKKPVYIFNLKELNYIKKVDNKLHIGACTPLSDILRCPDIPPLLKQSISIISSPALRNLATLPGNIMNASPAGDTLPVLYLLNAGVLVQSKARSYTALVANVITGPRKTTLKDNEIITEVIIPLDLFTFNQFVKVGGRKADTISKVSFTGAVNVENSIVKDLRIAFGAVGPTVVRRKEIERTYLNMTVEALKKIQAQFIDEYKTLINPINDQRSNKAYRKQVAINLLQDFINNIR